jgi:hypothetical protein
MRQIWIPVVAALAIAGCASETREEGNANIAATWRHEDGTAVSGTEYAQARALCERDSQRQSALAESRDIAGNPLYHPGGAGLQGAPPGAGFPSTVESPNAAAVGQTAVPLADCLRSRGFVRANTG